MRRKRCRGCDSDLMHVIHDFGEQPLAGEFPTIPEKERPAKRYPLDLTSCRSCGLLQVTTVPPITEIFHNNYRYSSSTIPALVDHFVEYANWIEDRIPKGARVLEFGCNDGVLLQELVRRGYSCQGVDASANIVELARRKGLKVDNDFFGMVYVEKHRYNQCFDLITCSNVYAHIDDISAVISAAHLALAENGKISIEVHDGSLLLTENQFDTIYHEHLTYFTVETLTYHLERHGFIVIETKQTEMHGGGLRVLAQRTSLQPANIIERRVVPNVHSKNILAESIIRTTDEIHRLKRQYGSLWAFGAAGRAQMFLNFTSTSGLFECVYDDSPLRQNRYIVGTDLSIVPFNRERHSGACVILAWNYAHSIVPRIAPYFDEIVTVLPNRKEWKAIRSE